jgi:L-fucose isomerase-like protein
MMALDTILKDKLKELFGKNWEKISRENAKPKVTGIIIDAEAIEKAKKAYEENPSRENKQKLNDAYIENELVISQNEAYYLYNQYKDPANSKSFENKFGPDYERIMQEITDVIDPRVKEFADWQVNELFPTLYEQYNAVYRKIFRVNMPWNEFYAGRIYREGVEQPQQDL